MQGIYTYIPETNYACREYSVAAILLLLFMVLVSLVSVLNLFYFYINTFRSMCAVIIIIVIIIYFLQLSFHSVAVVLTLVQAKQIRMNIHKQNNIKHSTNNTKQVNVSTHITKTPTPTYKHPHITIQVKTTTVNEDFLTFLLGSVDEAAGQLQDI